jgi:hypothetical protein
VKNSCLHHITRVATAKEAWDELQTIYQVSNISNRLYLRRKFIKLKMDDDKSMSEHIHMFRSVLDELIAVGVTIQDDEQLETFLGSISQSYQNVVDVLSNTAGITLSSAMSKLLQEELRRKSDGHLNESSSSSSVFWTKKKSNFQKRKVINTQKRYGPPLNKSSYNKNIKKVKCFNCNNYGHIAKDCTNTKQERKPNGHKLNIASEEPPNLFIAALLNTSDEKENWYLDSSASHHITPNRNWFIQYTRIEEPERVYLGNNTYCDVIGKGSITVQLPNGQIRSINEVLHVPDLRTNLISVGKVTDSGYDIAFNSNECVIRDLSREVICTGQRQKNLYKLDIVSKSYGNAMTVKTRSEIIKSPNQAKSDINIWHCRMGHIGEQHLKLMSPH